MREAKLNILELGHLKCIVTFPKAAWTISDLRANICHCRRLLMEPNGVRRPWLVIYKETALQIILVLTSYAPSKLWFKKKKIFSNVTSSFF